MRAESTRGRLAPHPRLYISESSLARLREDRAPAYVKAVQARVTDAAATFLRGEDFEFNPKAHNSLLVRGRIMQTRVVTLLVRYFQTGDARFRDAVVRHIAAMGRWEYWSWITWRQHNPAHDAIFDLSYGENSATLAIAYDLLHDALTAGERSLFLRIARERALRPFLKRTRPGKARMWWFGKPNTNWNTVCAGGAGMLALAMHEELPESRRVLPRVEESIRPFILHLGETDGGWEEGVGYWNYGMRYAFMYLLSAERARGSAHPLMRRAATRKTIRFPLDFAPNMVGASFGDVNAWAPLPFHFAVAARFDAHDVLKVLTGLVRESERTKQSGYQAWPNDAEMLVLRPAERRRTVAADGQSRLVCRRYRGMDWAFLADEQPFPRFYCSVRGGTTDVPHGQRDLMSYCVVVRDEALIQNVNSGQYLDSTFCPRRDEVYDLGPASKNGLLINGLGIAAHSRVYMQRVALAGAAGLRIDGTQAMGTQRDGNVAHFCGRLFVMLDALTLLIVDRMEARYPALFESRAHTCARVNAGKDRARIRGARRSLQAAWASTCPALLGTAQDPLTWPRQPPTMLRWTTAGLELDATFATVFTCGARPPSVSIKDAGGFLRIHVRTIKLSKDIVVTRRLRPVT